MYTILDYLQFRGDLSFKVSPFNEVDNLLLTQLSYVDLKEIVPSSKQGGYITLENASKRFFEKNSYEDLKKSKSLIRLCPFTMEKMAGTERFKHIRLSHYEDDVNEEMQSQFSAMHIHLLDGTTYIVFRGTDDTLVGWREDFNMLYQCPIEGQKRAVEYLNNTVGYGFSKLRLGGHSKGGNLAVYAAVECKPSIKRRILHVFNNDGPGFLKEFVEKEEYKEMLPKIISLAPKGSIFGLMLEHAEEFRIVQSNQLGLLQHDVLNWGVLANSLEYVEAFGEDGQIIHDALNKWIEEHDEEQKKAAIDALFGVIEATQAKNLSELLDVNLKGIGSMIQSFVDLDGDTKQLLLSVFSVITGEYNRNFVNNIRKVIEKM